MLAEILVKYDVIQFAYLYATAAILVSHHLYSSLISFCSRLLAVTDPGGGELVTLFYLILFELYNNITIFSF